MSIHITAINPFPTIRDSLICLYTLAPFIAETMNLDQTNEGS